MASTHAEKLGVEFNPEPLSVKLLGTRAYAAAVGILLNGVRLDRLKIEAMLTSGVVTFFDFF
jgi:hypothetical protein